MAEKAGVKLMTAFQRRYDPSFARLHKAIADGAVGDPISAILQVRNDIPDDSSSSASLVTGLAFLLTCRT